MLCRGRQITARVVSATEKNEARGPEGGELLYLGDVLKGSLRAGGHCALCWSLRGGSNPDQVEGGGVQGGLKLCMWEPLSGGVGVAGQVIGEEGREQRGWGGRCGCVACAEDQGSSSAGFMSRGTGK